MDAYYVWITLGGMHLNDIPGGRLDEVLQYIWDLGGIAGRFQIAQHDEDQVVFCVRRTLHEDIEFFMSAATEEDPYPVFTWGIGNRKIAYEDGNNFDGLEISNKVKVAQFKAEYREGLEQVDPGTPYIDLFKRARITGSPPDPALNGEAILP